MQDLAVASPATVSRCGMVYIDPDELKWKPYVQTWISGLGEKVRLVLLIYFTYTDFYFPYYHRVLELSLLCYSTAASGCS